MIDVANVVTVVGRLVEGPSFSETEDGRLATDFHVRHGENTVWCTAVGAQAESAKRFASAGVEVLISGKLEWLTCDREQPHVRVVTLGYTNPQEVAGMLGLDWN